jgi:hypothetical protein
MTDEQISVMDPLLQARIFSVTRFAVAVIGSGLALLGHHISEETLRLIGEVIGGVFMVAALVWSQWNVIASERKAREREHIALNAGISKSNGEPGPTAPVPFDEALAVIHEYGQRGDGI